MRKIYLHIMNVVLVSSIMLIACKPPSSLVSDMHPHPDTSYYSKQIQVINDFINQDTIRFNKPFLLFEDHNYSPMVKTSVGNNNKDLDSIIGTEIVKELVDKAIKQASDTTKWKQGEILNAKVLNNKDKKQVIELIRRLQYQKSENIPTRYNNEMDCYCLETKIDSSKIIMPVDPVYGIACSDTLDNFYLVELVPSCLLFTHFISLPIIDNSNMYAIFSLGSFYRNNGLNGRGKSVLCKNIKGKWTIIFTFNHWVS